MKFVPPDQRQAISAVRLALSLVVTALVPLLLHAAPAWWSQRNAVIQNAAHDDYAAANQGQLKNIARAAAAEMDARIPSGGGDEIHSLISSWSAPTSQTNDFAPLTVGQLKSVAKAFYNQLIAIRYAETYPWIASGTVPDDFAVANIGQVKNLFNFDLLSTDAAHDTDRNSLPDWWERYYFGKIGIDPNAPAARGDGLTNLEAFQRILDPIDAGQFLAVTPERIDEIVPTGQTVTRRLTVTNKTSAAQQLTFIPHSATITSQYAYIDSDQENGPQFIWNDISASGIHMDSVSEMDDGFESLQVSFSFPFSGQNYSTIYVASNGYLTFGQGWNEYWNEPLPSPFAQGPLIAAFWDDLNLGSSGDVYFQDFGDRVVIQFTNAIRYDGDGYATFQIVLLRDGTILLYYKDMVGTLDQATVGVQSASSDDGFTISYNQPYLKSDLAVRITQNSQWQPAPWLQVSPATASLLPGATAELSVTLDGRTLAPGTLAGGITISADNGPVAPRELPVTMTLVDESQLDNDNDGLTNGQERALGTDPNNIDTDRDGMADGWEIAHALNPLLNDSSEDPDGDGFDNLQEYQLHTDPYIFAAPARVVETFNNWNYLSASTGDLQLDSTNPGYFDGDTSRAARTSPTTASLTYWMPALISADLTVYYKGSLTSDQVRFFASPDNATWTEVAVSKIADWATTDDWHGAVLRQSYSFLADTRYLRIDISGPEPAWTPQLSQLVFVHTDLNRPVADSQNVTVFAGAAAALVLRGRDADQDPLTYRITEQPAHGTLSGAPPNIIYTAASDYVGQDRFSFVTNDGARDSAPANVYVTVQAAPPPAPTNLTFTEMSSASARLTWSGQGATAYTIERSTDGGLTWQLIGEVNGATTSFLDSSYRSGTFYSYRVRAKGETGSISEAPSQISSKGTDPTITDSDGDGIPDNLEAQRHSNPDSKDTDGDGVPDGDDGAPADPTRWAKAIERQYAVIDLGTLPGSPGSQALAINNLGHVLCLADPYGRYFLWQDGRRTALPGNFTPYGLSDSDTIVGDTTYFYPPYSKMEGTGAYWTNGQLVPLPQATADWPDGPRYPAIVSSARAINNADEIVGWSTWDGSGLHATKWIAGGPANLIPGISAYKVRPFDISDSGAVLASAEINSGYEIDLLPSTRLGVSSDPFVSFEGFHINKAGVIISRRAQIWPDSAGGVNLNTLLAPGTATTVNFSYALNNENEILAEGHDETGDYYLTVVRLPRENSPAIVYKVIESDPRIEYIIPIDMNDNGLIAGTAVYNDHTDHAILLVPAELMVDGNRDGEMSFDIHAVHDADQTSEEKPYRFWVNDDSDGILDGEDTVGGTPDSSDAYLKSLRDLEDFTR
ncbi:MAG: Ig-like domain-containing protein, partial [Chthoniobacterales bacterium]